MAAAYLPAPGTEHGPCIDGCEHWDCARTRRMAETICALCPEPIGYDRGVVLDADGFVVHHVCLLREAEGE